MYYLSFHFIFITKSYTYSSKNWFKYNKFYWFNADFYKIYNNLLIVASKARLNADWVKQVDGLTLQIQTNLNDHCLTPVWIFRLRVHTFAIEHNAQALAGSWFRIIKLVSVPWDANQWHAEVGRLNLTVSATMRNKRFGACVGCSKSHIQS